MKELSIFIDESGDFGDYSYHSPYYIITMIFHNQDSDIKDAVEHLNNELSFLKLDNLCIHTGPIIRKEDVYQNMSIIERRLIFNKMMALFFIVYSTLPQMWLPSFDQTNERNSAIKKAWKK